MSFYRKVLAAVFAMSLTTGVFAEDAANNATNPTTENNAPTANTLTEASAANTSEATQPQAQAADQTTASAEKVDVNKADAKELMKVKGISAARAKAIISYRNKHGNFKSIDDLKEVKGFKRMNEKTMQKITDQLTVG